jgi:hypothetical protein
MDDELFDHSTDDAINDPVWQVDNLQIWGKDAASDHIRDFRIAHNAMSVYKPCSACGALYYRGPFHIVLRNNEILCHECAAYSLAPITLVITRFNAQWHEHLLTFDKASEESTRLIIGTRSEQIPEPTLGFIERFYSFTEANRLRTVHGLESPNRFMLYSAPYGDHTGAPLLQPEKATPLDRFFTRYRSALLGVGYLFFQQIKTNDPESPLLLRTLEEWKKL